MLKKIKETLTRSDYVVISALLVFLVYKQSHLSFRFGDGDVYFYMAQSIIHGHLPYRNFFLADPPVFLLFLVLLKPLFASHWLWYQALPIGLEMINAGILYLMLRPKLRISWLIVPVYLFSFTVLSTSDFSTGVQLTVMFSLLAWYFWQREQAVLSGIAWALAILTKLYALPAFMGFLSYLVWQKQKWSRLVLGVAITGVIILLPFFLASPHGFIQSIIVHQLHRTAGNNPWSIWSFFLKHEWVLVLLGLMGMFLEANRQYVPPFLLTIIFFIFFKDLYYLYLAYFFPYLVIFSVSLLDHWWQDRDVRPLAVIGSLMLIWSVISGVVAYQNSVLTHGRFLNAAEIGDYLKTQTAHAEIYGSHEVAPLLALFSGKQIFDDYIDTNTQVFAAHSLDLNQVSEKAADRGVYLVARITDLPDYEIKDQGYEGYFSAEVFKQACKRLKLFPSTSQEADNYIGIYDCHFN